MTFAIFSLVEHKFKDSKYYGYAPYIREMNLWGKRVDKIIVVAPFDKTNTITAIDLPYDHQNINFVQIPSFNIKSLSAAFKLLLHSPSIFARMTKVMIQSDHLHFRCPSNVSAMAAIVQMFFPKKMKSTKWAGNFAPNSGQPLGYRFQKKLLTNTFLTKNMQVLVYGEWPNQSKYVIPFVSATYFEREKIPFVKKNYKQALNFVFIGNLVIGKRPLLTIKIIEELSKNGYEVKLFMLGDGPLMNDLKNYISAAKLEQVVELLGNQTKEVVKEYLSKGHFTILPSKSEGWPKAIAEGMFFGCIPISTRISCLEWMLKNGKSGILIEANELEACNQIIAYLKNKDLSIIAKNAQEWSQKYTVERLEHEIAKVLNTK